MAWGLGHKKTEKRKEIGIAPAPRQSFWVLGDLLSVSGARTRGFLLTLSLSCRCPLLGLELHWESPRSTEGKQKCKLTASLVVLWLLVFPSLPATADFSEPSRAAQYLLSRVWSCIQQQRQGGDCFSNSLEVSTTSGFAPILLAVKWTMDWRGWGWGPGWKQGGVWGCLGKLHRDGPWVESQRYVAVFRRVGWG